MKDALRVSRRQSARQLDAQRQHLLLRQSAPFQPFVERSSGHVFQHQVVHSLFRVEVVHGFDVGVVEAAKNEGFATKTFSRGGIAQRLGIEHLDGDIAFQSRVPSAVSYTHAASADFLDEAEMAKGLPGGEARCHHMSNRTSESYDGSLPRST